jgi:hypothetical protein
MKRRPLAPRFGMGYDPGLCGTCRHGHRIDPSRGTRYWRCRRSEGDTRYPRYPPLPVLGCPGWEEADGGDDARHDPEPFLQTPRRD